MADLPGAHGLGGAIAHLRQRSGWILGLGIALLVCGVIALLSVVEATAVTVLWVGVMMIAGGVIEIVHGFRQKAWGRSFLWVVTGAFYVFGGFFAVLNPLLASLVLTLVLAIALLVAGIMRMVLGFHIRSDGHPRWIMLSGLATFLFGLIILVHWPVSSLYALGIILGVDLIQTGVGWIGLAMFLRRRA